MLELVKLRLFEGDRCFGGGEADVNGMMTDEDIQVPRFPRQGVRLLWVAAPARGPPPLRRRIRNAVCQIPFPYRRIEC